MTQPYEHLHWPCGDCGAKSGEPCRPFKSERPWSMDKLEPFEFHHDRKKTTSFARRYPEAIAVDCATCGQPAGRPCRPTRPNRFGKVSDYACEVPHGPRRNGFKNALRCQAVECGRVGTRRTIEHKRRRLSVILCEEHA